MGIIIAEAITTTAQRTIAMQERTEAQPKILDLLQVETSILFFLICVGSRRAVGEESRVYLEYNVEREDNSTKQLRWEYFFPIIQSSSQNSRNQQNT